MEIISKILEKMNTLKIKSKVFIEKITKGIFSTQAKINFRNISPYIDINEKTILRNYNKYDLLNISKMNEIGIKAIYKKENKNILSIDCIFIEKSGKKTYSLDKFWDGKNSKSKKGLEVSLLSLIDTTYNTGYSINAIQTPSKLINQESRMVHYLKQLYDNKIYYILKK